MTDRVSINVVNEALNMEACVSFLAEPMRLIDEKVGPEAAATNDGRPGSGMIEMRRELPLPESETDGDAG